MSSVEKRNIYVGHRYVPKILGEWDIDESYEGLSIVTHKGDSFTSKRSIPVGINILDEMYWVVTGNYNAQIESYRKEVRELEKKYEEDILLFKERLQDITVNVKDFGAIENTNATLEIQNAVDFVHENGGGVVSIRGNYLVEGERSGFTNGRYAIEIKENVVIDNSHSKITIIPTASSEYSAFLIRKSNTGIFGGVIKGDKFNHLASNGEWGHGVSITGDTTTNVFVKNIYIDNCWGDGIYIIEGYGTDITIDNVIIKDCRRHELAIVGGEGITIKNSSFTKSSDLLDGVINATYGGRNIDIEPHVSKNYSKGLLIENCFFRNPAELCVDFHGNHDHFDSIIENCIFDSPKALLKINNGKNHKVINTKFLNSLSNEAIQFADVDVLTIEGCEFNNLFMGVRFVNISDLNVDNHNIFKNINNEAIHISTKTGSLKKTKDINIKDNEFDTIGSTVGSIRVQGNEGNRYENVNIKDNNIKNSLKVPIFVRNVDGLKIVNNEIDDFTVNTTGGIFVTIRECLGYLLDGNSFTITKTAISTSLYMNIISSYGGRIIGNKYRDNQEVKTMATIAFFDGANRTIITGNDFYRSMIDSGEVVKGELVHNTAISNISNAGIIA